MDDNDTLEGQQPLDSEAGSGASSPSASSPSVKQGKTSLQQVGLLALIGAGRPDFDSPEEADAFIRAERATWGATWSS
jgi:hypothetical protein